MLSRNYTILGSFDAEDAPAPLLYTDEARGSHLLKSLPADVVQNLQDKPIAMENHVAGEAAVRGKRWGDREWEEAVVLWPRVRSP